MRAVEIARPSDTRRRWRDCRRRTARASPGRSARSRSRSGMTRRDVEQAFARSDPLMPVGGERREAESIGIAAAAGAGRSGRAATRNSRPQRFASGATSRAVHANADSMSVATSSSVVEHLPRHGAFGRQPAVPAMSGRVQAEPRRGAPHRPVAAVLQPLEVAPHVRRAPRCIAGQRRDAVPIGIVRRHQDHRIVRGAAAERAGARIEDALAAAACGRDAGVPASA